MKISSAQLKSSHCYSCQPQLILTPCQHQPRVTPGSVSTNTEKPKVITTTCIGLSEPIRCQLQHLQRHQNLTKTTNLTEPQNILHSIQKLHWDLEYYLSALSPLSHRPWHSVLTGSLATDFKFQELNEFLISPHKTSRPCRLLSPFLKKGNRVQGEKKKPKKTNPDTGEEQAEAVPHIQQQRVAARRRSRDQLASSWNTSPRFRRIQQEFTNKLPSTLQSTSVTSRAEQRLLLMHSNNPASPEEHAAAHPLPLTGERSELLLYASTSSSAESLGRAGRDRAAPTASSGKMLLHFGASRRCRSPREQQHGSVAFPAVPFLTQHGNILPCSWESRSDHPMARPLLLQGTGGSSLVLVMQQPIYTSESELLSCAMLHLV